MKERIPRLRPDGAGMSSSGSGSGTEAILASGTGIQQKPVLAKACPNPIPCNGRSIT